MLTVETSPHIHSGNRTDRAMLYVIIALLPSCIWGICIFGLHSLFVVIASILTAVLVEYLLGLVSKEFTIKDYSAIVTGLLVGMNMPPEINILIPMLASAFAIAVVKWTFGGLGANWANPAIAGRIFVFFSFTSQMSSFKLPRTLMKSASELATAGVSNKIVADAFSGATPLSTLKTGLSMGLGPHQASMIAAHSSATQLSTLNTAAEIASDQAAMLAGRPVTSIATTIGNALNINPYAVDEFLGNSAGCIGEVSAILLLVGGLFLLLKKVITWRIPVCYIGSFAILAFIFGGIPYGNGLFAGEILLPIFSGGLFLGAFFMATDWVTTPTTPKGEVVFAIGCGFFTFLFRYFGSLPEGVSLAILLMNIVTPTIDRFIKPRKFGYVKPEKKEAKA